MDGIDDVGGLSTLGECDYQRVWAHVACGGVDLGGRNDVQPGIAGTTKPLDAERCGKVSRTAPGQQDVTMGRHCVGEGRDILLPLGKSFHNLGLVVDLLDREVRKLTLGNERIGRNLAPIDRDIRAG